MQSGNASAVPTVTVGSATVDVGDVFTIPVSITDAVELTSWQFDLAFDQAIVRANAVTEGPFMSSFGTTLFGPGVIDKRSGLISLVTDSYVDLPPNPATRRVLPHSSFSNVAWGVSFNAGGVGTQPKSGEEFAWCVRGGQGVDPQ